MRRHGPGLFCVLLSVVASAGAAGCRGGRSRPPDPAPVNLRFTELTSLPTYLTNNPVAAVRDESLGWVLVTSTGLGPGKARTSIEDATWALPLADAQSDEDSRWRRLPAPPAGPRIGATMVALGDELWLVGGYTVASDDEETTLATVESLRLPSPLPDAPAQAEQDDEADDEDDVDAGDAGEDDDAANENGDADDAEGSDDEDPPADTTDVDPPDASASEDEAPEDSPDAKPDAKPETEPPPGPGWRARTEVPVPVDDTLALAWRDRLVLVSGWSQDDAVDAVQIFDPAKERWSEGSPIPGPPVFGHAGAVIDDTVIFCDGARRRTRDELENDPDDEPVAYTMVAGCFAGRLGADPNDPGQIAWRALPPHPGAPRYRMAAGVLGPYVIFVGGTERPYNYDGIGYDESPAQPARAIFAWDTQAERWWVLGDAPRGSMDHRGLARLVEGEREALYLVGGMVDDQAVSSRVYRLELEVP